MHSACLSDVLYICHTPVWEGFGMVVEVGTMLVTEMLLCRSCG